MVEITIQARGGKPSKRFPLKLEIDVNKFTINQLKKHIQSKAHLSVHRQRLTTVDKKVLENDEETLAAFGIKQGDVLEIKDLGPQICRPPRPLSVTGIEY